MAALALVGRRHDGVASLAPGGDDALHGLRREIGPVGEEDDRRLDVRRERLEPAAERRAGPALPIGAANDPGVGFHVVRAEDDDDLVHRRAPHPFEHLRQEQPLLRRAEARRGPCREDDGGEQI